MNLDAFVGLPDDARVWIYPFEQALDGSGEQIIRQGLGLFIQKWVSHEAPVSGVFDIFFHHFVVVAAHCPEGISGCSIDSLVQNFKGFRSFHGLNGLKGGLLFFRNREGTIQAVEQLKFRDLIESRTISVKTPIFQPLINDMAQLRSGEFEIPFESSSLARVFPLPAS
ncbi:MAG: hypothetical protein VYA53_01005 [Acidobacteriota bacterium]|nr:hypothetical protein [Acidobacteriota bacterium]